MSSYLHLLLLELWILADFWTRPDAAPRTLAFGVRLPPDRAQDPVLGKARRLYRTGLGILAIMAGCITPAVAGPAHGYFAMTSPLLLFLMASVNYCLVHFWLRRIKLRQGWYSGQRQVMLADMGLRLSPTRFPIAALLPALTLLAAGIFLCAWHCRVPDSTGDWSLLFHSFRESPFFQLQWLITTGAVLEAWLLLRCRPEIEPSDPARSVQQYRIFCRRWAQSLLLLAACADTTLLLLALRSWDLLPGSPATALLSAVPLTCGAAFLLFQQKRLGQGGCRLEMPPGKPSTGLAPRDDDRHWKIGYFYFNPADPSLVVPRRFGLGWDFNYGRPLAWLCSAAPLLTLILVYWQASPSLT